jgi:hypothetical protein
MHVFFGNSFTSTKYIRVALSVDTITNFNFIQDKSAKISP